MSTLDLNSYVIFAKVVENQSFTKAAQALGLEKSTVSSKISNLESHLGEQLLERNTRSLSLTAAGEGFYRYCEQIVKTAVKADEHAKQLNAEPQGLLRISAPPGIERILYHDLFNCFARKYPKIEIEVDVDTRMVDLVKERFDIALRTSNSGLKDSSLVAKLILDIKFGFFASSVFLENFGDISDPDQLAALPYIHPFSSDKNTDLYAANKEICSKFKNRVIINNLDACIAAMENNLGVAVLPVYSIKEELAQGSVVQVLTDYELPSASLYVTYPSRQWQPAKMKVFLEFIQEWAEKYEQNEENP